MKLFWLAIPFIVAVVTHGAEVQRNYGIFIGINGTGASNPLKYAANDAVAMASRYIQELGLIPAQNARIILDGEVSPGPGYAGQLEWLLKMKVPTIFKGTSEAIQECWDKLASETAKSLHEGDLLIVFVSGHGAEIKGIPYLKAPSNVADVGLVSLEQMAKSIAELDGRSLRLLLIDACRGRDAKGGEKENNRFLTALQKTSGWFVFSSCSSGQKSYEYGPKQLGLFTACFLDAARGAFDTGDSEIISLSSIMDKVSKRVEELAWADGMRQRPSVFGDGSASAIPIGVSPSARFVRDRFNARLQDAIAKVQNIKMPERFSDSLLFILNGSSEHRQSILIPRIEALSANIDTSEQAELAGWWRRFMETETAVERGSLASIAKGGESHKEIMGCYIAGPAAANRNAAFCNDLIAQLSTVDSLNLKMLSNESAVSLEETVKPPEDRMFELNQSDERACARYRIPAAMTVVLAPGESCSHILRFQVSGDFSAEKAVFGEKTIVFVHRIEWSLISRADGEAVSFAHSGYEAESAEEKFGQNLSVQLASGKSDLSLWPFLDPKVQKRILSEIADNVRASLTENLLLTR